MRTTRRSSRASSSSPPSSPTSIARESARRPEPLIARLAPGSWAPAAAQATREVPAGSRPNSRSTIMKIALDPYMHRHVPLLELPRFVAELGYEYVELSPRADFLNWWVR